MRIAAPSIGTEADGTMLLSAADGILAASVADDARILTELLLASLVCWAIRVHAAFNVSFRNCNIKIHSGYLVLIQCY